MSKAGPLQGLKTRRHDAAEWFDLAQCNAEAAVLLAEQPRLRCQSLYFTQQSMEAATKGLARNAGVPHDDFRTWSHNNLNLLLWCVDAVIESSGIANHIRKVFSTPPSNDEASDVIMQLEAFLAKTADLSKVKKMGKQKENNAKNFFTYMITLPPEGVLTLLKLLTDVENNINQQRGASGLFISMIAHSPFSVRTLPSNANVLTELVPQILFQFQKRIPGEKMNNEQRELARKLISHMLECAIKEIGEVRFRAELKAMKWKIPLDHKQIMANAFDIPLAVVGVFILGTLVWPHESYPRYPAHPCADESLKQAAEQRKMGIRHYSDDLGVISHIQELAGRAHAVAESLSKAYKLAWFS